MGGASETCSGQPMLLVPILSEEVGRRGTPGRNNPRDDITASVSDTRDEATDTDRRRVGLDHPVEPNRVVRTGRPDVEERTVGSGSSTVSGKRLIPIWYTVVVVGILTVVTLVVAAVTAAFGDGFADMSMWGVAACCGLVLIAALSSLVRPRRRKEPEVLPDGTRVFKAPALTVWPLVGAFVAAMGTAAAWGWVMVTDFGALESPGICIVVVLGSIGLLPDFARLLTGRLHRWTLVLGPDELIYRGYRTDVTYPWKEISGAEIQRRGPAGVRIDLRGAQRTDPVVPLTAFTVPAEQLIDEIVRARKAGRR